MATKRKRGQGPPPTNVEAGYDYVWWEGRVLSNGKWRSGHWRKTKFGEGTHRVHTVSKGKNKGKTYIQRRQRTVLPGVRLTSDEFGRKHTQVVRGYTQGKKGVSGAVQERFSTTFFSDKTVAKTRRSSPRGLWQADPKRAYERRFDTALGHKHISDATAQGFYTLPANFQAGGVPEGARDNPNRVIVSPQQLKMILEEEERIHRMAGMQGAYEAGMELLDIASERIPVDTGYMRDSGFVQNTPDGAMIGYAAHYAIYQHEDLTYEHRTGEAKWLEKTIMANQELVVGKVFSGIRRLYGHSAFGAKGGYGDSAYGAAPYAQFGNPDQWGEPGITPIWTKFTPPIPGMTAPGIPGMVQPQFRGY